MLNLKKHKNYGIINCKLFGKGIVIMKTLYLHIGMKKTGSTAIQHFLLENNEFLNKNGYIFPQMTDQFNHSFHVANWRNAIFLDVDENQEIKEKDGQKAIDECFEIVENAFKEFNNVVLSDELLFERIGIVYQERIEKLLDCAEKNKFNIQVIIYLRKQSEYMCSRWKQHIKENSLDITFDEYVKNMDDYSEYNYKERLDCIAKIFGKKNIIVRRYERDELKNGSSIIDFLETIGIKSVNEIQQKEDIKINNYSLTNNLAYIKHYLNGYMGEASRWKTVVTRRSFEKALETETIYSDETSMMSSDTEDDIMERFSKINDAIAREFIGDGRSLFNKRNGEKEKWEFNNESMLEDLTKSTMAMFSQIVNELEKQRIAIRNIKEKNRDLVLKYKKLDQNHIKLKARHIELLERHKKLEKKHNALVYKIKHPITSNFKKNN